MDQPVMDQPVPPPLEVIEPPKKKTNPWVIVLIVLVALCCLCILATIIVLALMGPAVGNVFSNVMIGLGTPAP